MIRKKVYYNTKNTLPYNEYSLGSFMNNVEQGKGLEGLGLNNMSSGMQSGLSAATDMLSSAAGNAISGGLQSGAGNYIGGLSKVAAAIPGPWGMVSSAGLNVLGGLTNRAFGSKLNQQEISNINANTSALRSFNTNAGDFDTLTSAIESAPIAESFNQKDVGKDGWFSNKAKKKYNQLQAQQQFAEDWKDDSIMNNLSNIQGSQMNNLAANFAAFGGDLNSFANGGSIYINPANRGKFTATKKRTGKSTEELTHSKNPLTKKRAIFAQNAAKWNHAYGGSLFDLGGPLHSYGTDWSDGITSIDNGGTHEQNPMNGVPMGTDANGKPNLVEQGETIWNDYVFSNRIPLTKDLAKLTGITYKKDMSFSDAVKELQKPSEERPNDPIEKRGLEANLTRLQQAQELIKGNAEQQPQQKKCGGKLYAKGGYKSSTLKPLWRPNQINRMFDGLDSTPDYTNPNEVITPDTLQQMSKYQTANPIVAQYLNSENTIPTNPNLPNSITNSKPVSINQDTQRDPMTALRFAPAVGSAASVFSDLMGWTNKPDYSGANEVLGAASGLQNVRFSPIGDYLGYTPLDKMYYINQLNANAGAARRSILSTAGGNRGTAMAGLLASDYNNQNQLGSLARQADEYNMAQKANVAAFNRGTNEYNTEGSMRAQQANDQNQGLRINAVVQAANMRDAQNRLASAGRSANLTNLLNSLGDIGRESYTMDMINRNKALLYDTMGNYKGNVKACGGSIKRRGK